MSLKEVSETFDGSENSFKDWRKFHSENKNLFFNLGPENNWQKYLKKNFKRNSSNFEKEMKELDIYKNFRQPFKNFQNLNKCIHQIMEIARFSLRLKPYFEDKFFPA